MEFSIFLSLQRIYPPASYDTSVFEDTRREAELAEALGYDMVWLPEHHLVHFIQAPNALMLAQYVGKDLRMRVGTMAVLLTTRHPLVTAGEIALTDNVLEGRLELGVGRGAYEYEFQKLGVPFEEGKARFGEALEILEKVWASPEYSTSHRGEFWSFDEAAVWPHPIQRPNPPLWIAAMTPPTIAWAAAKGYHVSNWPFIRGMDQVAAVAQEFHANRVRPEQKLAILMQTAPVRTEAQLEQRIDEALVNHRINQRLHFFTQNASASGYVKPEPLEIEPSRREVRDNLLFGYPDECLSKIEEYARLGVTQLMLFFDFGPSRDDVMEGLELFAKEVIVPFRSRAVVA